MSQLIDSNIRVGTSGWSYKDWVGNFYPPKLPSTGYLKHYSSIFSTVEIDSTFYRIPAISTIKKWADTTPNGFVFAAKFPRTVTHEGTAESRLRDIVSFTEAMRHLEGKLGPLLLQFPYSFKPDSWPLLERLIAAIPSDIPLSVEVRNKAWLENDPMRELLRSRNISWCLIEHPWFPKVKIQTADFLYLRFLGDQKGITEDYSYIRDPRESDLVWWANTIKELSAKSRKTYVYFNNHFSGHAPTTSQKFIELLQS
jgi:uncharacterized protein YecE (DUF72 family)